MAVTSLESIRRISIEAQEKGLADVAAKLDKVAKAQEGVVASSTSVEKSSGSVEQAFKRTERSLDANIVAYDKYARSVKAVVDAQAQGLVTQQRSAELISLAEVRLQKATGTMDKFGKATATAGGGPATHELVNLSRQLQDVGVGLAGGQGIFTIVAQQGPQIADVIATSKSSLGDFVSTAVSGAGRFLAAWGPLAAGVAAVGGAAAAAMQVLSQQREARIVTTSGRGRLSGVSAEQVPELADASRTAGVSLGESRQGVEAFIKVGATYNQTVEAMALSTRLAATTGTSLADAYTMLAGVIRDPTSAAKQLDDQFQILDRDQQKQIASAQAVGDRVGAASQVFRALGGAIASGKDATTAWTNVWAGFVTQVQKGIEVIGRIATMQQPPATSEAGQRAAEQDRAIKKPGFATAIPGETARTLVDPAAAQQSAQAVQATAAAVSAYEAEVVKATRASTDMLSSMADSARAFELQKNVMMATTVEERALATQAQVLDELTKGQTANVQQLAQAEQAANAVRAQSLATTQQNNAAMQAELGMRNQLIAAAQMQGDAGIAARAEAQKELELRKSGVTSLNEQQQAEVKLAGETGLQQKQVADAEANQKVLQSQRAELGMGKELIAAAGMQGAAGVELRGRLQEELQMRQQGIDVTSQDSQERIKNAGAIALQRLAMQDAAQAAQVGTQIQGQIQMYEAQAQAVGKSAAEKARILSLAQSEVQALAAEAQGMTQTAATIRAYAGALSEAAAAAAQAQENQQNRELQTSLQGTLDMKRLEISLVGASTAAHAYYTTQLQYENQAKMAEVQGNQAAADSYREYGQKIANATYQLELRKQALQETEAAEQAAAAAMRARNQEEQQKAKAFQAQKFESTIITTSYWTDRQNKSRDEQAKVADQMRDAQRAAEQKQLGFASATIQDQIQALQDQKSALQENTSAIEKATSDRRAQLDKEISKLEKALNPSKPDPYAERNPDYFYRFGTQAFKENDPMQELLTAAEAERDGLDAQLDTQKKAVELQQKAIDEQIKGYEAQVKELNRASNLLSNSVDLSAQEVSGIQGIIAAIGGLGDYSRLQAANVTQTAKAMDTIQTAAPAQDNAALGLPAGTPTYKYGYQSAYGTGFSGFFAAGGYIPPGSWGIAGESGPEVISKKRAVAGPATVTPIDAGGGSRPIVVNQTIVSQGGMRELRASRGELAQRSSSEVRRSLGSR